MPEQDQQISEVVEREQSRLRSFIRRRVPDPRDAEGILQERLLPAGGGLESGSGQRFRDFSIIDVLNFKHDMPATRRA